MAADPGYLANLMALPQVDRERLSAATGKSGPLPGSTFSAAGVTIIDAALSCPELARIVRGWDLAADARRPKATIRTGLRAPRSRAPKTAATFVLDHRRMRGTPAEVEKELLRTRDNAGGQTRRDLAASGPGPGRQVAGRQSRQAA
jgi:hypothetical protein